jgi:predicted amidohydrolase
MEETAVLKAVTSTPAAILGQPGLGRLTVGGPADLTVLEETDTPYSLTDRESNTVSGTRGYRCRLTVTDGTVVYCD